MRYDKTKALFPSECKAQVIGRQDYAKDKNKSDLT
jgi:hypothetical protein